MKREVLLPLHFLIAIAMTMIIMINTTPTPQVATMMTSGNDNPDEADAAISSVPDDKQTVLNVPIVSEISGN